MKRVSKGIVVAAVMTLGVSTAAFAGFHQAQQVVIIDASSFANGDLGYVHNTPDTIQYIGCTSSGSSASCFARNLAGLSRSCSTSSATMLDAIHALNGDSYLIFGWNASGQCTFINVQNASLTAQKS
jgi:hypothetical protein